MAWLDSAAVHHIVWDWNGTLFDDLHIVVEAVNACLVELGVPPIDADGYRDHYTRPVRHFYAALLDRPVDGDEFARIDRSFHAAYAAGLGRAALSDGARAALDRVTEPSSQSLLSMSHHDQLMEFVEHFQIDSYMARVDGSRAVDDGSKAANLERHLGDLRAGGVVTNRSSVVVIGDSLDDARAAREVGVGCVLFDGGTHHRNELEAAGVPVAGSLSHALDIVGVP